MLLSLRHRFAAITTYASVLFVVAPALAGTVTGEACFPAGTALPADAVLELVIEDISRADAPARVLARRHITPRHGPSGRPAAVHHRHRQPGAGRQRGVGGGAADSGAGGSNLNASPSVKL